MLPITGVPEPLVKGMKSVREIFCRAEGLEHVGRFITGLILSPNKTLHGIYDAPVWEGEAPSRRAMHEGVFESGWDWAALIQPHRTEVAQAYRGRGRQVIALDGTLAHHERGPKIYAVTKGYDYVERRTTLFQAVVTAVVSNSEWIDGLEVVAQDPNELKAEAASAKRQPKPAMSGWGKRSSACWSCYTTRNSGWSTANGRRLPWRSGASWRVKVRPPRPTTLLIAGVLTWEVTRRIESRGKQWVSEVEVSCPIQWPGRWGGVEEVAAELRQHHPGSFRKVEVSGRKGEEKVFFAFTQVVRLKR